MVTTESLLLLRSIALTGQNVMYAFGGSLVTLAIILGAFAAAIVSQKEDDSN
jgi:hypothetical protein